MPGAYSNTEKATVQGQDNQSVDPSGGACARTSVYFPGLALLALFLECTGQGHAAEMTNLPPTFPPPDFLSNRSPLPDLLLKDKRVDRYVTGFPAIGWDPETGFNYGAALQWFDNGPADSPFFRYTPYRQRLAVAATGSTGGSTRALVGYDRPYVGDSPWRIRAAGIFEQNKFENYFGVGESTLGGLTYPGSTQTYDDFDDYTKALERNVGGQTWARYNDYEKTQAGGVSQWSVITGAAGCARKLGCNSPASTCPITPVTGMKGPSSNPPAFMRTIKRAESSVIPAAGTTPSSSG
jgi:hypothetical protein